MMIFNGINDPSVLCIQGLALLAAAWACGRMAASDRFFPWAWLAGAWLAAGAAAELEAASGPGGAALVAEALALAFLAECIRRPAAAPDLRP